MFTIFVLTLLPTLVACAASTLTPTGATYNLTRRQDSTSYMQAAYFANWDIYGANFQPSDIDPSQLTHILYAFADARDTGEVYLTDSWADEQKHFQGDSWSESGNNLYGCLKQLYLLKLSHRHLKVLLSVGGWTYSQAGHFAFISDSNKRGTFVSSAIQLIKDYGFDGIDIDYEFPASVAESQYFLDLMTSLRSAMDALATANGDTTPYELTAAVSAGSDNYVFYPIAQLDAVLSYWNLMAYDYAGPWLTYAGNQANLYSSSNTGISTDAAVKHYIASGATAGKIAMGIPLYGRAFENTKGIGQPYNGVGPGTLEAGIYSYKDLPLPGASDIIDSADVASYSYDPVKRELVSYDVPEVVRTKARYVTSNGLAGCMFWELSTDKTGADSLVRTAATTLGALDQTPNHIHYPHSKWDNVRNNMAGATAATPTAPGTPPATRPTTTPSCAPTSSATAVPYTCLCDDVPSWSATVVYVARDEAVYNGHLWTAKWWTEGDAPADAAGAGVWVDEGVC